MQLPIREAVLATPNYPFSPVDAPVKLDQNESPEDFPVHLKALVLKQLAEAQWHRHPDLNCETLSAAIGGYEGWLPAATVVTTGSNVLIALLIQLAALDGRVVTVTPNFSLYGLDAKLLGSRLTEVPLRADLSMDVQAVIAALGSEGDRHSPRAGVLYIPRPHAPTGYLAELADMERLAEASAGWLLVIDEAYHQFSQDNAMELARRYPHVVLLRTFSKAWALAGIRLGYALTSAEVARQLRKLVPPFAVSTMQTICAQVALANPGYMRESVERTIKERERLIVALAKNPCWSVLPSTTNFLLIRTPDAARAFECLLAQGVAVRRQDSQPGLDGCIRVTVGSRADNDAFLKAVDVCTSQRT
jgi:histidinol-phosphate aminotransferase